MENSGAKQLVRALFAQPEVQALSGEAKDSYENAVVIVILKQALLRAVQAVDSRFENTFDVAITTYLLTLNSTHPQLARVAAEAASPQSAQFVLERTQSSVGPEYEQVKPVARQPDDRAEAVIPNVKDSLVIGNLVNTCVRQRGRSINITTAGKSTSHAIDTEFTRASAIPGSSTAERQFELVTLDHD
jgi:hypothetical protein